LEIHEDEHADNLGQVEATDFDQTSEEDRIVHGIASNSHAWPWMASLQDVTQQLKSISS